MAQPYYGAAVGGELPPAEAIPAVAPMAVPAQPRTYRELYADAANNPSPARTGGYLAGYRFADPGGGVVPAPATLRDQTVFLSDRQPMAFLALVTGADGGLEVVVVHRLLRYVEAPGDDPTGLNDYVLGLMGDILPHQYPVVDVPNTTFHLVSNAVRVPTTAAMATLLLTWNDGDPVIGPFTEQDPETEVIRTRHVQLIPGRYASVIIHRRRVRPKQAYQEIVGAIQAQNEVESCHDVIAWLRAACTARGGGGAQTALPSVLHAFTPLHLPPEVYRYVTAKVQSDLPVLVAPERLGGGPGAETLAGALRILEASRATRGGREGEDVIRAPRTIVDAYKETFPTLLKYCNAEAVDGVAPLWHRLANCHKGEQHTVLTQELQKVCMARGLSTELYVPVITSTLKQMVVSFQFTGYGADDLTSGCQPFLVAYAGTDQHYLALSAANVGNQLAQGEHNASLADYRTIRESEKVQFPRDISDVCITMTRFAVLCQCLFQGAGAPHPFTVAMWNAAASLQNIAPFITERYQHLARHPGIAATYHARIVRAIQLNVHDYLSSVATNVAAGVAGIPVPVFDGMLTELKRGTFHQSTNWVSIPDIYLDATPTTHQHVGSVTSTPSGVSTAASHSTTRTGVSSITTDTERVARINNLEPDSEFTQITLRAGGTRRIMQEHRPPSNDAGNEFCVAWWTKGGCFPNCGRRLTHRAFASAAERTRLLAYVREHLQAPAAAAAGGSRT